MYFDFKIRMLTFYSVFSPILRAKPKKGLGKNKWEILLLQSIKKKKR